MLLEKYVNIAVANIEEKLVKLGLWLPFKCSTPFSSDYHPSIDITPKLDSDELSFY